MEFLRFVKFWLDGGFLADIDLDVVQYHKEVAESLGCSTLECLQDKSADEIFSKLDVLNYCPISEIVPNPLIFAPIDDSK